MNPRFFNEKGPLDFAAGEKTISAWKTTATVVNGRDYITIAIGDSGDEDLLGQSFEVLALHFAGGKIAFNKNHPVNLAMLAQASNGSTVTP